MTSRGMDVSSARSTMELVCEKNPNEKVLKERKKTHNSQE